MARKDRPKRRPESLETVGRFEPALLEQLTSPVTDVIAEISATSAALGKALNSKTAANLADLVRVMNTYYSNLIEGHDTRPRDIERALAGHLDDDHERRNLQLEAAAHVRVQKQVDEMAAAGRLPEPASSEFLRELHREFYREAPQATLIVRSATRSFKMTPGEWRSRPEQDVAVGRHMPPSSGRVDAFMSAFAERYRFKQMGKATRIMAMAAAHHRFNYIHPFPDGNGRVSRLMSHAMGLSAGIGAHGLWSISRGLARGLARRGEYKEMMDHADMPRQGDLDGRGNLSQRALTEFVTWFLRVCLDQITFMTSLFEIDSLATRLRVYVERSDERLHPATTALLGQVLVRGEVERGEVPRIVGLPPRTARRILNDVITEGLLASDTPKGPVSLRFPIAALEVLFPSLYPVA
jgi:Fic family protein